jgi:hypothetical protein
MQRHHEVEFAQFIETLYLTGATTVTWDRVYMWFNATRLSNGVWQTIHTKFVDLCESEGFETQEVPLVRCVKSDVHLILIRDPMSQEKVAIVNNDGIGKWADIE